MFSLVIADFSASALLRGNDSAAAASVRLLPTPVKSPNGLQARVKSMEVEAQSAKPISTTVYFELELYDPDPSQRLPNPAPPPKMHYATFWRVVTRKIYNKRLTETMQVAREPITARKDYKV